MENNQPDISALLSALGSNPAILNVLSNVMSPKSPESPRQEPPSPKPSDISANGIDPRLLSALSGMLRSSPPAPTPPPPAVDYGQHSDCDCADKGNASGALHRMLGGKAECENRIRLLNALRPYLSEERRGKLDLLLKLLKIAELGQLSGILNSF